MNYHLIRTDDMLNGSGLRVVLFVSGCDNHCDGCHNPETWDINGGIHFDNNVLNQILKELDKDYISGLTISGGEPLKYENLPDVYNIITMVKTKLPNKNIWLYTGYNLNISNFDQTVDVCWDNGLLRNYIIGKCDVVCDGRFIKSLVDVNYPWVGSTNQRVIDVKKTLKANRIVEYEND